jgi:hypothetical protein
MREAENRDESAVSILGRSSAQVFTLSRCLGHRTSLSLSFVLELSAARRCSPFLHVLVPSLCAPSELRSQHCAQRCSQALPRCIAASGVIEGPVAKYRLPSACRLRMTTRAGAVSTHGDALVRRRWTNVVRLPLCGLGVLCADILPHGRHREPLMSQREGHQLIG